MIKKIKLELLLFGLLFLSIFVSYNIDIGLYNYFSNFSDSLNQIYLKEFFVKNTILGDSRWYFSISILLILFSYLIHRYSFFKKLKSFKKTLYGIGLFLFTSLLLTGFVTQILKHVIGRARPNHSSVEKSIGFDFVNFDSSFHSFPSGHTSTIFAVALVFAYFVPRLKYFFIFFACVIGFSRVVVGAHFFTDIIGGVIVSYICFKISKHMLQKYMPAESLIGSFALINNKFVLTIVVVFLFMLLLSVGPTLDIYISSLFYYGKNQFLLQSYYDVTVLFRKVLLRLVIIYILILPIISVFFPIKQLYFGYKFNLKDLGFLWFSVFVNIVIVINLVFKNSWGRARPDDVLQLGGNQNFTAWFELSDACSKNCSFVSGDAAVGFSIIVFYFLIKKSIFFWLSLIFGLSFGAIRILEGGHFTSDVLGGDADSVFIFLLSSKILFEECLDLITIFSFVFYSWFLKF